MTTFAVEATLILPEHRERAVRGSSRAGSLSSASWERSALACRGDLRPVPGRGAFGELWHSRRGVILSVGTWM